MIDPDHPEAKCDQCGGPNIVWWVDSDRFNAATERLPNGKGHIICPICFVRLHEQDTGMKAVWRLVPESFTPIVVDGRTTSRAHRPPPEPCDMDCTRQPCWHDLDSGYAAPANYPQVSAPSEESNSDAQS